MRRINAYVTSRKCLIRMLTDMLIETNCWNKQYWEMLNMFAAHPMLFYFPGANCVCPIG